MGDVQPAAVGALAECGYAPKGLRNQDRTFLKDGGSEALLHIFQRDGESTAPQYDPPIYVRDICFWLEQSIISDGTEDLDVAFSKLVCHICSSAGVDIVQVTLFDEGYVDPKTGRVARGYHLQMS